MKTVEDLLKILLDPTFNEILPHFFIRDLSRVPPVGTEHIDMSALLQEVAFLRSEVRQNEGISIIQEEVKNMKVMLDQLIAANVERVINAQLQHSSTNITNELPSSASAAVEINTSAFPTLQ